MRTYTLLNVKVRFIAICALVLIGSYGYCNTYTAIASGNWSSTSTWGGNAPGFNDTTDQITIATGITVNVDSNLTINGTLASLIVVGYITSGDSISLTLGAGAITGTGNLQVGTLVLDSSLLFAFTGSVQTKNFTANAIAVQLESNVEVGTTLTLMGGTLTLITGGAITLDAGATINMAGGSLVLNSGALNISAAYNVTYSNTSSTTGIEITRPFLDNVTIDVPDSSTVTLNSDLIVGGILNLQQGYLSLNDHALNIGGNLAAEGTGSIKSTPASNITFTCSSPPAGTLYFAPGANTVNNFVVNVTGFAASVQVGSNFTVNGILQLLMGSLNIGNDSLVLGGTAIIANASPDSYIVTGDSGALGISLTAGADSFLVFPVGTATHYDPALVQLASGSASGMVWVTARNGVDSAGTTGSDLSLTQPMVDATWLIESNITSNLNMNVKLGWSLSMETNRFNRDSSYISHYTSAHWDTSAFTSAAGYYGPLYTIERDSITSLSPFAIFGTGNAPAAITPIKESLQFDIYPNPATRSITVTRASQSGRVNMEIINMLGQVAGNYVLTDLTTNISLVSLESGNYFIRIYNDKNSQVKRMIKL